ncbi:Methyl-accepting chemotaxis protein (MCP) signalling domain-containing protein [Tindallia magadiensis]|uniref:Methyl-accepting chemotaxis protein (MCP) signalling domain-containing protein n=1 Tax=Tindallia magadiensis TaxID=69895 RepID=A0A1I3CHN1_9FIRM|nr:methyl-accepting chemotaxis protein [Tindallia magadiensis]SFH74007.1 Methyl-accepting chemotaxis protein (MCP) signalling domain-containing protein [Tindallia magadiensis]
MEKTTDKGKYPNIIQTFIEIAPYMKHLSVNDTAIAIADKEKYVSFYPGKELDFPVKPGDMLKRETVVYRCIKNRTSLSERMGSELFGFPYIAMATPLYEEGEIVGGVVFLQSTEHEERLLEMAEAISEGIGKLNTFSAGVVQEAEGLSSIGENLDKMSCEALKYASGTEEITSVIKRVSSQSNLLGLNASIEAARSGVAGKGFAVVAEEIRKLAVSSNESVENIEKMLKDIKEINEKMAIEITNIKKSAEEQVGSNHKVKEAIYSLTEIIEKLKYEAGHR